MRWVNQYALDGRIPGAEQLGRSWAIPEDAVKSEKHRSGPKGVFLKCLKRTFGISRHLETHPKPKEASERSSGKD